ncbi:hypothetical protein FRC04_003259 [Tulasnella sp. 424]|nr:hypothetical protein FRC04_003259 [Tulasnella sp. 424]
MDPVPINVTGHFNDIFLGYHETFGQVALRRPRISDSNYADAIRSIRGERQFTGIRGRSSSGQSHTTGTSLEYKLQYV